MSKPVFISYSSAYGDLKDVFLRLMQALGFESVYAFDHPDEDRVTEVIQQRIRASGAVVILYGPPEQPPKGEKKVPAAGFVHDEAMFALGTRLEDNRPMPIALFVHHPGTEVRDMLQQSQTAARFDFWDPASFQANSHHIVKHLRTLQRRMELRPGDKPYLFRKLEFKYCIESATKLNLTMYNHVVMLEAQPETTFHHGVNIEGGVDVSLPSPNDLEFESGASVGSESHSVALEFLKNKCNEREIEYEAQVTPPLSDGEEFSYWRTFTLPNWFPLTRAEIAHLAAKPEFPKLFGGSFYGDCCNVVQDLDSFTWAYKFPNSFRLQSYRVVVVDNLLKKEYKAETDRCQALATWEPFPDKGDNVLELIGIGR